MRYSEFLNAMESEPIVGEMGLVLAKLIERWRAGADMTLVRAGASRALTEVRRAGLNDTGSIAAVLDALRDPGTANVPDVVASAALDYANILFPKGYWDAARAVCDLVLLLPAQTRRPLTTARAHLRRAYAHRVLGDLEAAEADYLAARRIGRRASDRNTVLRARLGKAIVTYHRGDLPKAELLFRRLLRTAEQVQDRYVAARALHNLGVVLVARQRIDEGLTELRRALEFPEYEAREALIADSALGLSLAGYVSAARALFRAILRYGTVSAAKAGSHINLIMIAGWEQDTSEIDRHEEALRRRGVPPFLETDFLTTLGRARAAVGQLDAAHRALMSARELAARRGFGWHFIDAERAIARLAAERPIPARYLAPTRSTSDFVRVAEEVLAGAA